MTRVLVVNAGSSSVKLRLLGADDAVLAIADVDATDGNDPAEVIAHFVDGCDAVDAVGHRVVHGGRDLVEPVIVDEAVERRIADLTPLAPLHQLPALAGIRAARSVLPSTPQVACFDTAFHATIPASASTYALPEAWRERWPLRRFGFHGLSHAYAVQRAAVVAGLPARGLRVVSCHLGSGASLCAASDGRSIDTTGGFTPLEGLVMSTRSGSIDPGLVLWLIEHGGLSAPRVEQGLEHESGLAGLAGGSGDLREVIRARDHGDQRAILAFDVYVHRLRREIAAMTAALGGVDVIAFTGGVGEHAPTVRAATIDGLAFLGLSLDREKNTAATTDTDISAPDATTRTVVITAREDLEIARQVRAVLRR